MLGASAIGQYLDACALNPFAIEEVVSGYVVWKLIKGSSTARVLAKLRKLIFVLRASGRGRIVDAGRDAFRAIAYEVSIGSERIGISPTTSGPGKEIFNRIRRSKEFTELSTRMRCQPIETDGTFGGPAAIAAAMRPGPAGGLTSGCRNIEFGLLGRAGELDRPGTSTVQVTREPWQDRWFQERPQLRGAVPRYPERADPEDVGSLPMYQRQAERASLVLQRSESREMEFRLDGEAASDIWSMMDGLSERSNMLSAA